MSPLRWLPGLSMLAVMALSITAVAAVHFFSPETAVASPAQGAQKDYLTEQEADKIRDAQTSSARIKLFLSFADDRMKKLHYELSRTVPENRHDEILNGLLNDFIGCVDDAADQIDVAQDKEEDIRGELKLMKDKDTAFLADLQKIEQTGSDVDAYRYNLEDAIQGTKDALDSIADAEKSTLTAPVRRKPE